jgi:hypothetical protein
MRKQVCYTNTHISLHKYVPYVYGNRDYNGTTNWMVKVTGSQRFLSFLYHNYSNLIHITNYLEVKICSRAIFSFFLYHINTLGTMNPDYTITDKERLWKKNIELIFILFIVLFGCSEPVNVFREASKISMHIFLFN